MNRLRLPEFEHIGLLNLDEPPHPGLVGPSGSDLALPGNSTCVVSRPGPLDPVEDLVLAVGFLENSADPRVEYPTSSILGA